MNSCTDITRDLLPNPIIVDTGSETPDFGAARNIAFDRARSISSDPMLLAWFDKAAGKFSPDVICCNTEKPSWLVYAESRGGDISVDINDQDYVFVFAGEA
ncbi:AF1514 family protein [Thermodesulfobacteriota bacterium]